MAFEKISEADLAGKGVIGQPDVPGLSASEMQEKIEEVVRAVVIPKVNSIIDDIVTLLATKEELNDIVVEAGAVTSVFGRAGNITAQAGDYTAQQVGAAPAQHKNQHKTNGSDPLTASDIGAAAQSHSHGSITADGKVGSTNGKLLMTGTNGVVTAVDKANSGLMVPPATEGGSSQTTLTVTLSDNTEYVYSGVHALTLRAGTGYGETWGQVTFNSTANPTVTLSGFTNVAGDDYTEIAANETWEFSCKRKTLLWKKVSA